MILSIPFDASLSELKNSVEVLNKYYIEAKYPPDQPILYAKSEAEETVKKADAVLKMIEEKLRNRQ